VLTKGEKKGNLILGPTARDLHVPSHMNESREDVQRFILAKCRKLVDAFDPSKFFFFFFFFSQRLQRRSFIRFPAFAQSLIATTGSSNGLGWSPISSTLQVISVQDVLFQS
jgi:hypothetical protein